MDSGWIGPNKLTLIPKIYFLPLLHLKFKPSYFLQSNCWWSHNRSKRFLIMVALSFSSCTNKWTTKLWLQHGHTTHPSYPPTVQGTGETIQRLRLPHRWSHSLFLSSQQGSASSYSFPSSKFKSHWTNW